jgi:hypothetical protein
MHVLDKIVVVGYDEGFEDDVVIALNGQEVMYLPSFHKINFAFGSMLVMFEKHYITCNSKQGNKFLVFRLDGITRTFKASQQGRHCIEKAQDCIGKVLEITAARGAIRTSLGTPNETIPKL